MAIDSEKRARGLRVPSLASIKAFSKKNDPLQQHQQQQQQQQALFDAEKNLPSPPGFDTISPSSTMPAKRAPQTFGFDAVPMMDFESSRYPMPGPPAGPSAGAGAGPPAGPSASTAAAGASPVSRTAASPVSGPVSAPQPVQRAPMPHSQPQHSLPRSPSTGSPADSDPLEDYIPDPSPETDEMLYQAAVTAGPDGPLPNGNRDGDVSDEPVVAEKDDWEPPMAEVAAPLNKLHFNCYQEHRSMPSAANVWHAVPCMTCNRFDREVRHRCVFCCLRICEGCYGALQKCSRRSLDELLTIVR